MSDFDVLADERFNDGWLRENFEKLSNEELLKALVQMASAVSASVGRFESNGWMSTETHEMLVDALTSMSNVDW